MAEEDYVYAVVSGCDHDSFMLGIAPFEAISYYGNMDPECEEWLVAVIRLPRSTYKIQGKALQQDFKLNLLLCRDHDEADAALRTHPSWD
jgi:hypothetical protein